MDAYELDRRALYELLSLVETLTDADLDRATPCVGWAVRDLLAHMNFEHEAISAGLLGAAATLDPDPRKGFAQAVSRWCEAFRGRPDDQLVHIPKFDSKSPVGLLLRLHFADMLVHRWDLAKALGIAPELPADLVAVALPIAAAVPDDGPLRGPKGYAKPVPVAAESTPEDQLVAAFGRSPAWPAP